MNSPLPPAACSAMNTYVHRAMACEWGLQLAAADPAYATQAARAAFAEVDRLESELSRFVVTSDIRRINAAAVGRAVSVTPETCEVLLLALAIQQATRGAFDAAARRAGGTRYTPGLPAFQVTATSRTVTRLADALLDLGAIGKGFAIDAAAGVLRSWGFTAGLLHSGQSSVLAWGTPAGAACWTVALRDPRDPRRTLGVVQLRDTALSGSGIALHGNHILDPRCNAPAVNRAAAWALAPSAAVSDAVSTALMVLSATEAAACFHSAGDAAVLSGVTGVLLDDRTTPPQLTILGAGGEHIQVHPEGRCTPA